MGQVITVGPNEAVIVSGSCVGGQRAKRITTGGWTWAWALVADVQYLSLEIITLKPTCQGVETKQGVALTVNGVAQVIFKKEREFLQRAAESFLGRSKAEIAGIILLTLEGHLRAIIGSLTVEEILTDRRAFAQNVFDIAYTEMSSMGIEILSFTIKEIEDKVNYLNSIGLTEIANVKKTAEIGVAEANRDAGIKESHNDRLTKDKLYQTQTSVADSEREYDSYKATFDREVYTKEAEAELAFNLQSAKENQNIRAQEIEIEIIERRKLIEVEEKEIERRDKELHATVRSPAEAESFRLQTLAQASKTQTVYAAEADAQRIKMIGTAEAASIAAIGKAEAERMRLKAESYKQYGDAALMSLILEAMPKIAAEIAAPLGKTNEVLIINDGGSGGGVQNQVTKLLATLPPSVQALTGVDIKKAIEKLPGVR